MAIKGKEDWSMSEDQNIMVLCDTIRETAYSLRRFLGSGRLEKVYENGLLHRLSKLGLLALPQHPLTVRNEAGRSSATISLTSL